MIAADGWLANHPANAGARTERESSAQRVVVHSAVAAARWPASRDTVVLTIRGAKDREAALSSRYRSVLQLEFEDVSESEETADAATISVAQATDVARFVRQHADARTLVMHCQLAISRSRSMAAAICDLQSRPYSRTAINDGVNRAVRAALIHERNLALTLQQPSTCGARRMRECKQAFASPRGVRWATDCASGHGGTRSPTL